MDERQAEGASDHDTVLDRIRGAYDWETIFRLCPETAVLLDSARHIVRINQSAEDFLGHDAVGTRWDDYLAPSPIPAEQGRLPNPMRQLDQWTDPRITPLVEGWFRRADNQVRFMSWSCRLLTDDAGQPIAFLASGRDLTVRHTAEEELREKQSILRSVLDNTLDGIVTIDAKGTIIAFNRAAERLFGYAGAEVVGHNVATLMPEPHQAHHDDYIDSYMKTGKANIIGKGREVIGLKSSGDTFPFFLTISQPIAVGQNHYFIGLVRDLSSQKEVEAQLRQAQKMESIGTLAGGIAHDFNNILGGIMGYAELMMEDAEEGSFLQDDLREMLNGCHRAKALVQQILTFSRQDQPTRQPCTLQPIVKESLKLLRATIPVTVELRREIDEDCGPVLADVTQVHQLMMNLCTNAYHAMSNDGGIIEVILKPFFLNAAYTGPPLQLPFGNYIRLTVRDNGCGIDERTRQRIFEPFFTTKPTGRGTGMGLAVVHGIVSNHDGAIVVQSKPDQGSTFHIYFPEHHEPSEEEALDTQATSHGKGHIMLVDDDAFLLRIQQRILHKQGYEVTGFKDPEEALTALQSNLRAFDLVLTDQTMPHMTGLALAKAIAAIRDDLPILLTTGYSELVSQETLDEAHIREVLMKPVKKDDLIAAMGRHLPEQGTP